MQSVVYPLQGMLLEGVKTGSNATKTIMSFPSDVIANIHVEHFSCFITLHCPPTPLPRHTRQDAYLEAAHLARIDI